MPCYFKAPSSWGQVRVRDKRRQALPDGSIQKCDWFSLQVIVEGLERFEQVNVVLGMLQNFTGQGRSTAHVR